MMWTKTRETSSCTLSETIVITTSLRRLAQLVRDLGARMMVGDQCGLHRILGEAQDLPAVPGQGSNICPLRDDLGVLLAHLQCIRPFPQVAAADVRSVQL